MVTAAERPRIEAMWVVHLMLTLAALYAVIIAGMFFAQTRLLFPTMVAGAARVQLPASTQRIEVRTHDGDRLAGVRIPAQGTTADAAPTLLGFGGNAWNAEATALTLHALFPNRNVVAFHYRGYAPSSGRPSAQALFSDSLVIYDHLLQTQAGERILPVGFSIGAAIAAYLARHRSVAGLILVTPFDSLEAVARDLYWWAPVGLLIRNRMPTIEFVRGSLAPTALIIAERDASAAFVAPSLLSALQRWRDVEAPLRRLSGDLDTGRIANAASFAPERCLAPLPRAPQWLDGSAFLNHVRLIERAFGTPPIPDFDTIPDMYQRASDDFLGPHADVPFVDEQDGIDFEGEFGVVVDEVAMATGAEAAAERIRLIVQINEWSLRAISAREMLRGFGVLQAKPSTSFAPVALRSGE